MKRSLYAPHSFLLFVLVLLVACNSQGQSIAPQEGAVTDYDSLVDILESAGTTVEPAGTVTQPFFTPQGQVIKVEGQDVQVFEYDSEAGADGEADLVSPDGSSVGTSMMTWIATPHFYKSGRIIVLFVGNQNDTIEILEASLGPQFAGG